MYGLPQISVRFALRGLVSEKKKKKIGKKSKIFNFLTFNMYGLPQISVRFALRGLVSEKKKKLFFPKKSKIFIFFTFYMLCQLRAPFHRRFPSENL